MRESGRMGGHLLWTICPTKNGRALAPRPSRLPPTPVHRAVGPRGLDPAGRELAAAALPHGKAPRAAVWLRVVPGAIPGVRGTGVARGAHARPADGGGPAGAGGRW